jgi:hypothetical protein
MAIEVTKEQLEQLVHKVAKVQLVLKVDKDSKVLLE